MRSTVAAARLPLSGAAAKASISWSAVYISSVFLAWTLSPFLHRLSDWKAHYSAISPFGALPILMLVPAAAMIFAGRARRINRSFEIVALLWMLGFGYALVVSALAGHVFGGIFTFVSFSLPLAFGIWIATRIEDTDVLYARLSQISIVLAVITGLYGILQYSVLPPWDKAWMESVQMNSIGLAEPFEVRVFSMLNSPATFGAFLVGATIMYLPRLSLKSGVLLLPIFIGLGLSMLRAGWITMVVSILVFAMLTSRRTQILKGVAVFIGVGVLALAGSQTLFSVGVGTTLQNRLLTLTDIGHDGSAADRANQIATAFSVGLDDPEGSGLGTVGVSTRLNNAQESVQNLDSGYLSRFVEMGIPGMLAFLGSLAFGVYAGLRVWRTSIRNGDAKMQDLAALAISMQVSMIMMNLFGDASVGLEAVMAWASLGLIFRSPAPKRALA